MATFGDVWRSVKLHASSVPTLLCKEWAEEAWKTLARFRPTANYLRAQAAIQIQAARTVTITTTLGSATVTSAGEFVAGDVGRQLRVLTYPEPLEASKMLWSTTPRM